MKAATQVTVIGAAPSPAPELRLDRPGAKKPLLAPKWPPLLSFASGYPRRGDHDILQRMARLLLHVGDGDRRVVEADTIYYAEGVDGDTRVRRRAARTIRDVRELGEVARAWRRHGFIRIHDDYLVHPDRIQQIRKRRTGRNWEVKLAPPVNVVLPVSRRLLRTLWRAFEG